MDRVWIRGTSGSGKTTLGLELQRRLGISAIDLDDLHWMPEWTERSPDDFQGLVAEAVLQPRWAISGNYRSVRSSIEPAADTVVWLDYPLFITFVRVLRRTLRRSFRGELCCNGNREDIRRSLLQRDSILLWCLQTHHRRHRECLAFMASAPIPGQVRLRHRSPRETAAWLARLDQD